MFCYEILILLAKQVPTKTDTQSSSTRNRTEESQIVFPRSDTVPSVTTPSDSSMSNTPCILII